MSKCLHGFIRELSGYFVGASLFMISKYSRTSRPEYSRHHSRVSRVMYMVFVGFSKGEFCRYIVNGLTKNFLEIL